jgi:hypothetical protein
MEAECATLSASMLCRVQFGLELELQHKASADQASVCTRVSHVMCVMQHVIQLARAKEIKTVNVIRERWAQGKLTLCTQQGAQSLRCQRQAVC